jgi:DNA-binding IclR family transcriptional regulator
MRNAVSNGGISTGPVSAVQSVDRALTVLEILARSGENGVTEIAAELGVHKSTAFRLVSALESRGMVEQVTERGKYRLGYGVLRLAGVASARLDVIRLSRPFAEQLASDLGETANLTVLWQHEALYVDQVASTHSALQMHNWVGQHIPVHCTANGKALISWLPRATQLEMVGPSPASFTERTITKFEELVRQFAKIRERGWADAVEELEEGLAAVAAPIWDRNGRVSAALSLSGPAFRLKGERLEAAGEAVYAAAMEVSLRLGYSPEVVGRKP